MKTLKIIENRFVVCRQPLVLTSVDSLQKIILINDFQIYEIIENVVEIDYFP